MSALAIVVLLGLAGFAAWMMAPAMADGIDRLRGSDAWCGLRRGWRQDRGATVAIAIVILLILLQGFLPLALRIAEVWGR